MSDFTKLELQQIGDALLYGMAILDSRKDELMAIRGKVLEMIEGYCDPFCTNHELIRLKLLNEKEYDFCETCLYIKRMR